MGWRRCIFSFFSKPLGVENTTPPSQNTIYESKIQQKTPKRGRVTVMYSSPMATRIFKFYVSTKETVSIFKLFFYEKNDTLTVSVLSIRGSWTVRKQTKTVPRSLLHFSTYLSSCGLSNLLDKSCHLSVTNSYRRDTSNLFQLPIIPSDADSPGTILWNYVRNCLSPGQLRLHCKPITANYQLSFSSVKPQAQYSPLQPLGKTLFNSTSSVLEIFFH